MTCPHCNSNDLETQRTRIWDASLEDQLRELARRPTLASSLPAVLHELKEHTPYAYSPEELVRCAIALIRIRTLGD